ncbi:Heavy metal transport/detoxification protein [Pirellula staleyi DSM 6068]|uniref:Heavy metal transport/detoxification protein n=1 Tax=Pirellula staleyi (strain ATCC 27377 / DSM 6068 / ICPB 4128) TaxID=530564 RepID=D2R7U1_PIRSD|nr:heavy-metal-associated domain-containing protein [Pirellula staleyi]ADB19272.1 Heavy metal transport/detoxification protein [Pirellula staleyi DSM 6068]
MSLLSRRSLLLAAAALTIAGLGSSVEARAESPAITYTTIQVKSMHCDACAKKIARKLYAIPGVVEVRADVPKNIAYVVPQKDKVLSPKQMWEAVEAAGFPVASLTGPTGTFQTKPR